MKIDDGKIVSLLGGNGAGKSTTLKIISRLIQPKNGFYEVDGQSMLKESPSRVVKRGIIHCPENRRVFPLFTVEENLKIGAYKRRDKKIKHDLEKVFTYFPRLKERV